MPTQHGIGHAASTAHLSGRATSQRGSRTIKCLQALFAVLMLAACSGKQASLEISVPENFDDKERATVLAAWPKVRKACPGLDQYSAALLFRGVESNHRLDVVFEVKDGNSVVPSDYMAGGHRCFFGVGRDGASLSVSKEGCKAVCLGRRIQSDEPLASKDLLVDL